MTLEDYRARLRLWGLTPCKPSNLRHTIHRTRDGHFIRVPDPEFLSDEERPAVLDLLKFTYGLSIVEH